MRRFYTEDYFPVIIGLRLFSWASGLACVVLTQLNCVFSNPDTRYQWLMIIVSFHILAYGIPHVILISYYLISPTYVVVMVVFAHVSVSLYRLPFWYSFIINSVLLVVFGVMFNVVYAWPDDRFLPAGEEYYVLTGGVGGGFGSTSGGGDVEREGGLMTVFYIAVGMVTFIYTAFTREYYVRVGYLNRLHTANEEIRTMDTLRKMLPENVLTRMRNGQALLYDEFPCVTILFSHIHDFDRHTERLSGMQVDTWE